ncbi:MAG: MFS transporter [Lentisphaeria bacterium]|jgi:MFS family permease
MEDVAPAPKPVKLYRCGTLTYTKAALAILFFWLFWGDVCFTLMESVTGPIMLKKFERLGASNWEVALILSTIPMLIGSVLNPVVSFKSDRYRGRWGRRVPFLVAFLPLLVLALVGLAFGDGLGVQAHALVNSPWCRTHLHLPALSLNTVTIWTLGLLLVTFAFLNTFGTTSFWYLFRDVVPEELLGRFLSWFRVIGTLSAAGYSYFIFPYSGTHSTAIFLGAAGLYLVGFGLMLLNVREGEYPPPPPYVGGETGVVAAAKTFAVECHSHRIYWCLWLCTFIGSIGNGAAVFDLYFKQGIGLDMAQIGKIAGTLSITVAILVVGAGWLADRYHPARVVLGAQILGMGVMLPASMVWLFWRPDPAAAWTFHLPFLQYLPYLHGLAAFQIQQSFLIAFLIYVGIGAPVTALVYMWDPVLLARTFPVSRVGQFAATNNLWRSAGGLLGGLLAGGFFDLITPAVGRERAYLFSPVWLFGFSIPSFLLYLKFYKHWKRHGADAYVAPILEEAVVATAPAAAGASGQEPAAAAAGP